MIYLLPGLLSAWFLFVCFGSDKKMTTAAIKLKNKNKVVSKAGWVTGMCI